MLRIELAELVHDRIGQPLTLASLATQRAQDQVDSGNVEETRNLLATVQTQLDGASAELRTIIEEIHRFGQYADPAVVDLMQPSVEAVQRQAKLVGADVHLFVDPAIRPMGVDARLVADSVAAEGVANAIRHGGAGPITIWLNNDETGDAVVISVSSVDPRQNTALPVIREGEHGLGYTLRRVKALGGTLEVSRQNRLFTLTASIPVDPSKTVEELP